VYWYRSLDAGVLLLSSVPSIVTDGRQRRAIAIGDAAHASQVIG